MFHLHRINSLDLPELSPYRTLKRTADHEARGIFVAESEKVVRRLLESNFTVVSALLSERWFKEFEPLLQARPEEIAVYLIAEDKMVDELVGFTMFQGVLAVGKIPQPPTLDEVLAKTPSPHLLVAIDALANSENLGLLVRNCAAFGVQALIVGETSSSPYLRRSVRNSMGAIFKLPVVESTNLSQTLRDLRSRGMRCVAAHPHTDKKILPQADFASDCCIVFGSEGYGISPAVLEACDEAVAIPMANGVD
jgi:tRNA G18 (ribose-2'-O)-methylase SpoU